jgi:NADH-quinone oxidoreductase subunit J
MSTVIFYVFAAFAVVSATLCILQRNPVSAALWLVSTMFSLAAIYVLLDAQFIAAIQVLVYAGAVMVLFLFVIMLLNLQHRREESTRPIQQFLGYTGSALFGIAVVYYIAKYAVLQLPGTPFNADARAVGMELFQAYIFPFEMVSILLLAAIVGALFLSGRLPARAAAAAETTEVAP